MNKMHGKAKNMTKTCTSCQHYEPRPDSMSWGCQYFKRKDHPDLIVSGFTKPTVCGNYHKLDYLTQEKIRRIARKTTIAIEALSDHIHERKLMKLMGLCRGIIYTLHDINKSLARADWKPLRKDAD